MFFVERIGRRTLLATGGGVIVASLAALAALVASLPPAAAAAAAGPVGQDAAASNAVLLPAALVLLCVNRVALTCTLQPLAAAGKHWFAVSYYVLLVLFLLEPWSLVLAPTNGLTTCMHSCLDAVVGSTQ